VRQVGTELGLDVLVRQTDAEHEMLAGCMRGRRGPAVVLNGGRVTHYSYAVRDACALLRAPLVECTSPHPRREEFRHHS